MVCLFVRHSLAVNWRQRQEWQAGSEVSAYPTLAESDVPPSLPHRAETATTHAAQHLLVAIAFHLTARRNARTEDIFFFFPKQAAYFTSETVTAEWEAEMRKYEHISHLGIDCKVAA